MQEVSRERTVRAIKGLARDLRDHLADEPANLVKVAGCVANELEALADRVDPLSLDEGFWRQVLEAKGGDAREG